MRIAVVTHYFWPENFRINDLVQELSKRGHDVQVLTGQPNYPIGKVWPEYRSLRVKRSQALGCSVIRVPLVPRGDGSGLRMVANYLSLPATARLMGVGALRPVDVVLVYQPSPLTIALPALAIGKKFKAPVLMWIQDLWPETLRATGVIRHDWMLHAAGRVVRRIHRAMDGLLVQSAAFTPILEEQGVPPSKISYVPNWADDYFKPGQTPDLPDDVKLPDGFKILFAGNLGVAQGLEVMVGAAERLRDVPDLQWIVVGDGRQGAWLRNEVERRGLSNVYLMGQRPPETMPAWFSAADALLVTLRPDPLYELTIPSKVQAYLACGRPVLASLDGEGARQIEGSGAGLAAKAGDPDALAAAALKLHSMAAEERATMGRRARQHYEANFNRQTLIDRIEDLLVQAVAVREERTVPSTPPAVLEESLPVGEPVLVPSEQ